MSTRYEIRQRHAQEFTWLIETGVWWILVVLVGALAFVFLYRYYYWKKVPAVPANILSVKKNKGSHNTVTYEIRCEYVDSNGERHIAVYGTTKEPAGDKTQVRINPKCADRIHEFSLTPCLILFWIFFSVCILGCVTGALYI